MLCPIRQKLPPQNCLIQVIINVLLLQLLHWSEVSQEAELVVFSTLLAIQHLDRRADGEWTPSSAILTSTIHHAIQ